MLKKILKPFRFIILVLIMLVLIIPEYFKNSERKLVKKEPILPHTQTSHPHLPHNDRVIGIERGGVYAISSTASTMVVNFLNESLED